MKLQERRREMDGWVNGWINRFKSHAVSRKKKERCEWVDGSKRREDEWNEVSRKKKERGGRERDRERTYRWFRKKRR